MSILARARSLFLNLFRRARVERRLDEELAAYLAQLTDEKIAAGMADDEARREARLELGGLEQVKEEVRAVHAGALLQTVGQDLRYAARTLRRDRGFTLAVVVTIALGIGLNSAIFTLVNALLLRPLPGVSEPGRLVWLRHSSSYLDFQAYRDGSDVFTGLAALGGTTGMALGGRGQTDLVRGELVSAAFFEVLGVPAAHGRTFGAGDEVAGARPTVVLSHGLWQRRFGGDPGLVGRTVTLNGVEVEVVGITPAGFIGPEVGLPRDLWVPIAMLPRLGGDAGRLGERRSRWLNVIGRLAPGVTVERAEAVTRAIATRLASELPEVEGIDLVRSASLMPVVGGLDPRDREDAVIAAGLLMAIVGLVLLLACANVAGLVLARAVSRARELGIRRALGATRLRLVRQLLTECLLLSLLGGGAGLLLASFATDLIAGLARATPITPPDLGLDWRVVGFTLAASVATALLFGLAPALLASRVDMLWAVKNESSLLGGRVRRSRLRNVLVVAQVALSLPLLVGGGLFARSLLHAGATSPGFTVENGLLVAVEPALLRYPEARGQELYRRLAATASDLPGVERASWMALVPFGLSAAEATVSAEGRELQTGLNVVGAGYFDAMGIRLARGRDFGAADELGGAHSVVINETLARELFPGEDALGRRLRLGSDSAEIVGVAADSKVGSLGEGARPYLYQPVAQAYRGAMHLVVRTTGDPRSLVPVVRARIRALDPDLPLSEIVTLDEQLAFALLPARLGAGLLGAFGALALVLSAVGVYGLVAYSVRQRTHEIGVRTALGARRSDMLKLLVHDGSIVVAVGLAIGLALAVALSRALASLFLGVGATDPLTYAVISLLLLATTLIASYLPARRALRLDPMAVLRGE